MKARRVRVEVVDDSNVVLGPPKRRRWPWIVAGVVVLAVVAAALFAFGLRKAPRLPPIDLSQASPAVRDTIQRYLDEARKHPRSGTAWGQLGSVLYAYRLMPPARTVLLHAERLDPNNPRWPYLRGLTYLAGDRELVLINLRRTVELCGNQPPAPRLRLARLLAEMGHWQEAEHHTEALFQLETPPPHAFLLAAQVARQRGDLPAAIDWATRASTNQAVARPALALLSVMLSHNGDPEAAREVASRAESAPGSDLFYDPFDAEALALRSDPASLSERVHPLLAHGRLEEADAIVDRMIVNYPDYPGTWLAAGRLQLLLRNPATAEQYLRRNVQLDPRSVQGWFQLGMTLLTQKRDADAAEAFLRAVDLKPDLAAAWHNRGLALGRTGRHEDALAAFQQVVRHSPEHMDAYLLMADLQLRIGDAPAARATLDRAALLNPADQRIDTLRRKAENQ